MNNNLAFFLSVLLPFDHIRLLRRTFPCSVTQAYFREGLIEKQVGMVHVSQLNVIYKPNF